MDANKRLNVNFVSNSLSLLKRAATLDTRFFFYLRSSFNWTITLV